MGGDMKNRHVALLITGIIWLTAIVVAPSIARGGDDGYRVFRPDGPGPHPAVVFLSGCSGFKPKLTPSAYEHKAEKLRSLGFLVVWVDYLGRRNLPNCSTGGVSQDQAGEDAVAAALWVKSQPGVDPQRITAMGWSWGGGSVLAALADRSVKNLFFSRAILYYPYCMGSEPLERHIPVLVLRGGSDTVAPPHLCQTALESKPGSQSVKIVVYANARHGFDLSELPPKVEYAYGTLGYDPKAAAAAWTEVLRFLGVRP